jgi:hypothetical protein
VRFSFSPRKTSGSSPLALPAIKSVAVGVTRERRATSSSGVNDRLVAVAETAA